MGKKSTKTGAAKAQYTEIGDRLRDKRVGLDLSQEEVAAQLQLKRQGYAHYELGKALPAAADLPRLCKVLGMTETEFFHGVEREPRKQPEPLADPQLEELLSVWQHLGTSERAHVLSAARGAYALREGPGIARDLPRRSSRRTA